jgi:hypothetical protein
MGLPRLSSPGRSSPAAECPAPAHRWPAGKRSPTWGDSVAVARQGAGWARGRSPGSASRLVRPHAGVIVTVRGCAGRRRRGRRLSAAEAIGGVGRAGQAAGQGQAHPVGQVQTRALPVAGGGQAGIETSEGAHGDAGGVQPTSTASAGTPGARPLQDLGVVDCADRRVVGGTAPATTSAPDSSLRRTSRAGASRTITCRSSRLRLPLPGAVRRSARRPGSPRRRRPAGSGAGNAPGGPTPRIPPGQGSSAGPLPLLITTAVVASLENAAGPAGSGGVCTLLPKHVERYLAWLAASRPHPPPVEGSGRRRPPCTSTRWV